jgi:hypothetical protein
MSRDLDYEIYLQDMNYSVAGGAAVVFAAFVATLSLGVRHVLRRFDRKV